jgi:hypothetical protein
MTYNPVIHEIVEENPKQKVNKWCRTVVLKQNGPGHIMNKKCVTAAFN